MNSWVCLWKVFLLLLMKTNEWKEEFKEMNFFDPMSAEVYVTQLTNSYFDRVVFAYEGDSLFTMIGSAAKRGSIVQDLQGMAVSTNELLREGINSDK